jgi:hypothetical protein
LHVLAPDYVELLELLIREFQAVAKAHDGLDTDLLPLPTLHSPHRITTSASLGR